MGENGDRTKLSADAKWVMGTMGSAILGVSLVISAWAWALSEDVTVLKVTVSHLTGSMDKLSTSVANLNSAIERLATEGVAENRSEIRLLRQEIEVLKRNQKP